VEFGTKAQYDASFDAWMAQAFPGLFIYGDSGQGVNAGQVASLGGDWGGVDKWTNDILTLTNKVGKATGVYVPPNLVKAVMKLESGGNPIDESGQGAYGLMQVMPFWNGTWGLDYKDPLGNLELGIRILAENYQEGVPGTGEDSWEWAAKRYLGLGGPDSLGTDSNEYWAIVKQNWDTLNAANGGGAGVTPGTGAMPGQGTGTAPPPGTNVWNSIWGGFVAPISQEFGLTEFSQGNSMYDYSTEYTPGGAYGGHIGIDVGIVAGTTLYAPLAGEIVCAGTDRGNGKDSCSAYTSDVYTPGMEGTSGRIELLLSNGDVIIFGHAKDSTVKPGDIVTPGMVIGHSGRAGTGDHVHVEYRQKNSACNSGYCAVDPSEALKGNFTGTLGQDLGGSGTGGFGVAADTNNWGGFMRAVASGVPLAGSTFGGGEAAGLGSGGWNQELRRLMGIVASTGKEGAPPSWAWGDEPVPSSGGGGSGRPEP
jgi:murein DD-endopeptidase MepM/ murein hydrolase activator NlpD